MRRAPETEEGIVTKVNILSTVASVLHVNGVDDLIIQKEFGHKDLRTTQQCYCYDLTTDEERYEKIAKSLA